MPDQLVAEYERLRYVGVGEVRGRSTSYYLINRNWSCTVAGGQKARRATCSTTIYNIYRENLGEASK